MTVLIKYYGLVHLIMNHHQLWNKSYLKPSLIRDLQIMNRKMIEKSIIHKRKNGIMISLSVKGLQNILITLKEKVIWNQKVLGLLLKNYWLISNRLLILWSMKRPKKLQLLKSIEILSKLKLVLRNIRGNNLEEV